MSDPARMGRWWPEVVGLGRVLRSPYYAVAYPIAAISVGILYALLLPGLVLGGIRWEYLRFLTTAQWVLVIGMALLLPAVLLMDVFLWRNPSCDIRPVGKGRGLFGVLFALLPNALCCGPVVPALLALIASGTALSTLSPAIQYWIGEYEAIFYALALLLVWASLRMASKRLTPLPDPGSTVEERVGDVESTSAARDPDPLR